jgi:hypothetical protein
VTAVLALMGLFFVWSVALVSPPSANRALRVRLYKTFLWALMACVLGWLAYRFKVPAFIYIWMGVMTFLFCLQVVVSINERERWGARVARAIPHSPAARLVAFLFYSGSAGGVLFGMTMLGLTVAAGSAAQWAWADRWPPYWPVHPAHVALVTGVIGLYTYCFALSAVLLRRVLFGEKLKGLFTWVLAVILVSIGSALPYAIMLMMNPDRPAQVELDHPWMVLPNAAVSVYQAANPQAMNAWRDFDETCLAFTLAWAALVTLLALPWYAGQARAFVPLDRQAPAARRAPMTTSVLEVQPERNGEPQNILSVEPAGEGPG